MAEAVKADALLATDFVHVDSWVLEISPGFCGAGYYIYGKARFVCTHEMGWECW